MPGAESVTMELSEAVMTMPVTGKVSMASGAFALPRVTPLATMRAAVRCDAPMPSPSMMMMFFTFLPPGLIRCTSKLPSRETDWPSL
jgi:hypothetical protein